MHAVGVPYRVPTPQDQDSLRVLQYVEKQLAHFNPARSTSHQCKLRKPGLWIQCLDPSQHVHATKRQCMLHALCCTLCAAGCDFLVFCSLDLAFLGMPLCIGVVY